MRKAILAIIIGLILVYFATQGYAKTNYAPCNRITEDMIKVYDDKVVIEIEGARWSYFAPTGSMIPTLDHNSNAIEIVPENEDEVCIGDIIAYRYGEDSIAHRVVGKGVDGEGTYFIAKGDSLDYNDPVKIRFSDIEKIFVAILY